MDHTKTQDARRAKRGPTHLGPRECETQEWWDLTGPWVLNNLSWFDSECHWWFSNTYRDLTCKRGSVGQSVGLSIPRSSVRFRLKPDNSNSHEFELHRPSNKGTKLLLKVIKASIIIKIRHDLIICIIFHDYLCDIHHLCDFPWFALVGINKLIQ